MRISFHGNDNGFVMIDAIVTLFIAGIAGIAVLGLVSGVLRNASTVQKRVSVIIESRNASTPFTMNQSDE